MTEFEVKIWKLEGPERNIRFSFDIAERVLQDKFGPAILNRISQELADRLANEWWTRHGVEVLEQLAPGAIADAVRTKLTEKLLK